MIDYQLFTNNGAEALSAYATCISRKTRYPIHGGTKALPSCYGLCKMSVRPLLFLLLHGDFSGRVCRLSPHYLIPYGCHEDAHKG